MPIALRWLIHGMATLLMMTAIGAIASFGIFIQMIPKQPLSTAPQVDAIVVLTGGADRIEQGLKRFAAQPSAQFFITGVNRQVIPKNIYTMFEKIAPASAIALKSQIQLGRVATNTVGNAEEVLQWIKQQPTPPKRILLVTANYHMPRSLLLFKRALPDAEIIEDPVFAEPFQKGQSWWNHPKGQRLVYREFIKLIYLLIHLPIPSEDIS